MKIRNLLFAVVFTFIVQLSAFNAFAQDIHFSQFVMTPLQLDPSQAGKFVGNQRAFINYRNQWQSVASPYKTFGFSFDTHFNQKKQKDNFFGAGLSVYSDKAGDVNLSLTTINLSLAYHIRLTQESYISAGVQGGLLQSTLDATNLRSHNQFDGTGHNAGLNSGESFQTANLLEPDFSLGASYTFSAIADEKENSEKEFRDKKINVGAAIHHVTNPNFSFLETTKKKLDYRYVFHTNTSFDIGETKVAIQPSGFIAYQQKAIDFVLGTSIRYTLKEQSKFAQYSDGAAISLGTHYRVGDAFITSALIEIGSLAFGLSYDLNLSGLAAVSNGKGGFELSIRYINPNPFGAGKSKARFD